MLESLQDRAGLVAIKRLGILGFRNGHELDGASVSNIYFSFYSFPTQWAPAIKFYFQSVHISSFLDMHLMSKTPPGRHASVCTRRSGLSGLFLNQVFCDFLKSLDTDVAVSSQIKL